MEFLSSGPPCKTIGACVKSREFGASPLCRMFVPEKATDVSPCRISASMLIRVSRFRRTPFLDVSLRNQADRPHRSNNHHAICEHATSLDLSFSCNAFSAANTGPPQDFCQQIKDLEQDRASHSCHVLGHPVVFLKKIIVSSLRR